VTLLVIGKVANSTEITYIYIYHWYLKQGLHILILNLSKGKGKSVPLQARGAQRVPRS